jgi:transposase
VRGHENVLKRLLIHASAFNLGLWMRHLFGIGTPRALQGRVLVLQTVFDLLRVLIDEEIAAIWNKRGRSMPFWPSAITVAARM